MSNKSQSRNRKLLTRAAKQANGDVFPKHKAAKPFNKGVATTGRTNVVPNGR